MPAGDFGVHKGKISSRRDCDYSGPVDEQVFHGGINEVVRRGDRLYRPARLWSESVLQLLAHVRQNGFEGAPEPFGFDSGYEVLGWIEGEVEDRSTVDLDYDSLRPAARLLRRYHDATSGFDPSGLVWQFPAEQPVEVVLHGDAAPYNCVFRGDRPVAWIDFDTARPGPRLNDVAYGAYRFCLIREPLREITAHDAARVLAFADAYGLSSEEKTRLPETMVERLRWLAALIHERAAAGDGAFAEHLADGHAELYSGHADVVEESTALRDALSPAALG
jgi:Phosphotransferase enzyme family.